MGADEIDVDAKRAAALLTGELGAVGEAASAGRSGEVGAIAGTRTIADGLASGALDPIQAQELLIEQVLAEQLPPGVAPERLDQLRLELASMLANDPALSALLRP